MIEAEVETHLCTEVRRVGGTVRKSKWVGVRGAPDRLVLLPGLGAVWVELKRPGAKPRPNQIREHNLLRWFGERVEVIDTLEGVDALIAESKKARAPQ